MKKLWTVVVALALIAAALPACAGAQVSAEDYAGCWQDPYYGRALLRIMPDPADASRFDVKMTWGDSAWSEAVWTMDARYDAATGALAYEGGEMAIVTYAEGGAVAAEEVQWTDAEGGFALRDGKLLWNDSREARSAEFALERLPQRAPEADEIAARCCAPVMQLEQGTAGASLKQAGVAAALLAFAGENRLWDADASALGENALAARRAMDDGERRRFDENLPGIAALIESALADYAPLAGLFEDAGEARMAVLVRDPEVRLSWSALSDALGAARDAG